jgi:ElaA protein
MLHFENKTFDELSKAELYELLSMRNDVFIVEQECPYQDIDFKDQKAIHVLGKINNDIVAYARLFMPGDYLEEASIGRVMVKKKFRQFKYGQVLMRNAIETLKNLGVKIIDISAQVYLLKFYQDLGFESISEHYLEDDIPHVLMRINPSCN